MPYWNLPRVVITIHRLVGVSWYNIFNIFILATLFTINDDHGEYYRFIIDLYHSCLYLQWVKIDESKLVGKYTCFVVHI
jgi:hypothetical protein